MPEGDSKATHLFAPAPAPAAPVAGLRPADVLIHGWAGEQAVCLDVSVVNPLTPSALRLWPGSAVREAEARKIRQSDALCKQNGLLFIPVVMETYGGFGPEAMVMIRRLGKALATAAADGREDQAINNLGTKLSFVCQQGLARSLHARYTSLHRHNMFDGIGLEVDEEADDPG